MHVPMALAALPLIVGAAAGLIAADHGAAVAAPAAAAALLALISAAGAVAIDSRTEALIATMFGFAFAGGSLALTAADRAYHPPLLEWFAARPPRDAGVPVSLEGVLREDASSSGPAPSLIVDVRRVASLGAAENHRAWQLERRGGVRLTVAGSLSGARLRDWRAGRHVRVTALLRLPGNYLDPGVRDDRRALARRGIVLVGTAKSAALVEVVRSGSHVSEAGGAARAWVRLRLAESVGRWSARSAGIATAVLIGDRTGLSDVETRRLQDAGTYHVIAISGGNIAILTVLLMASLALLRVPGRTAAAVAIPLLLAYREVVIPAPSVQRAISAALLYLAARVLDHRGSALNLLAVAAVAGVAAAPMVLLDPGFLLSFGATLGILAAAARAPPVLNGTRSRGRRLLAACGVLLWTTLAAEAALLPIAALLFGRVTVAGLLLNFVAIPLMSVLQAASMAALALSLVDSGLATACGYVAHLAADGIVESARLTDLLPGLARDVVAPVWWVIVSYYAAAIATIVGPPPVVTRRAALITLAIAAVIVFGPGWGVQAMAPPAAGVRIVFLDVGQGDATAVLLPGGRALLVDAGGVASAGTMDPAESDAGVFDIGQRVVAPALRALGVTRLDALAITHGDPDHLGGVPAILRAFRPPSIWDGVPVPPHPGLRVVNDLADTLGLHWRTVQAGDVERIGPVQVRVLHPPLPDWERQRVRNDDSVVLDVRIGEVSVILPGDIGGEGERAILPYLSAAPIVVLKAPHHGSATSSTAGLLAALRPAAVIFSAGRDNRFGHPHPAVVARYRAIGASIWSTAEQGAVILDTDGSSVTLRGWVGKQSTLVAR